MGACQPVGDGAAGHRHVGRIVVQHAEPGAAPAGQGFFEPPGDGPGAEHAAVEQQRIRHRQCVVSRFSRSERGPRGAGVALQEGRQVAGDRWVGGVGQAEFDDAGSPPSGRFIRLHHWQKAIDDEPLHVLSRQLNRACGADQPGTRAKQGDRCPLGRIRRQQLLLGHAAALHELRKARRRQALSAAKALLDKMGQRQVHVVATQHQVVTDADAGEFWRGAVRPGLDLDQRQVGGAAAHVAHQHQPGAVEFGSETVAIAIQPVLKGGLRLFDQAQPGQAGEAGRFEGERPGAFVERGRNREDDFLSGERAVGKARVPRRVHMGQVARAGRQRRHLGHILAGAPGQDGRAAIHAGVGQPAFGAGHQPARHLGAEVAGIAADDGRRLVTRAARPRQPHGCRVQFARGRVVAYGGQQRRRGHFAGADQLVDGQQPNLGIPRRRIGDDGVAGAEIDADEVAAHRRVRPCTGFTPGRARRIPPSSDRRRQPAGLRVRGCRFR